MGRVWVGVIVSLIGACGGGEKALPGTTGPTDLAGFVQEVPDLAKPQQDLGATDSAMSTGPANASCAGATVITASTTISNEDATLATQALGTACLSGAKGASLFYSVTVPAGSKLVLTATPTDGTFDPVLRQLGTCTANSCADSVDQGYEGDAETLVHVNSGAAPENVLVAVGGYELGVGGTYDLEVQIATVAVNALCSGAIAVTAGAAVTGLDSRDGSDTESACLGAAGTVVYYSTTIPARTELGVTVTPTGMPTWDPTIRLLSMCGASSCLASADDTYDGGTEALSYRNTTMMGRPVILAIGGYDASSAGTFNLQLTTTALPPPAANGACASAIVVQHGDALVDQDASEGVESLKDLCGNSGAGKVLYYSAMLPANSQLRAVVDPTTSWDPVIRLLPSCGSMSCLGTGDVGGVGTTEILTYKNVTGSAVPVVFAVGGYSPSVTGTFDLDVEITALPVPPMNQFCATPISVTDGQTLLAQNLSSGTTTLQSVCLPDAVGPVLYYSAQIPAGHRLVARGAPLDASWDIVLRVLASCTATSCLGSADSGYEGKEEVVSYKNAGVTTQTAILAAGSYTSALGLFDLSVWIKPPPLHADCAQALVVTNGTSLIGEDGEAGTTSLATACVQFGTGKVLFYKATIAAGKTLTVTAAPIGNWDPIIRLLSACGAATCLASKDTGSNGVTESLTYTNSGSGPVTVQIAVGGYGTSRSYNLQVGIQ